MIETSGMAGPNPIAQTFYVDETMAESYHVNNDVATLYRLDAIVTVVDAKHDIYRFRGVLGSRWSFSPCSVSSAHT